MKLPKPLLDDIIALLIDFFFDKSNRIALVQQALHDNDHLLYLIDFDKTPYAFTVDLVKTLSETTIEDNETALEAVLKQAATQTGLQKQAAIQNILTKIADHHTSAPSIDNAPSGASVVETLFAAYRYGDIRVISTIHNGLSGAYVFLVNIKKSADNAYDGVAFAKIDRATRCLEEYKRIEAARTGALKQFIPKVIVPPLTVPAGWGLTLYEPAHETIINAKSLNKLIKQHHPPSQISKQIDLLLREVLGGWYVVEKLLQNREELSINDYAQALINLGGKERMSELNQRAYWYFQLATETKRILFGPFNDVVLPNPYHFIGHLQDNTHRKLVVPISPSHGDLHTANIISLSLSNGASQTPPWLIDLAYFVEKGFPLFDLAYLELDILFRAIPMQTEADWRNWLGLVDFMMSDILPKGEPSGSHANYTWLLVRPIRQFIHDIFSDVRQQTKHVDEAFELTWWYTAMITGLLASRRSQVVTHGQRIAALYYAARCLEKFYTKAGIPRTYDGSIHNIEFSPRLTLDLNSPVQTPQWVYIESGKSQFQGETHKTKGFFIAKTCVTQRQYLRFVRETRHTPPIANFYPDYSWDPVTETPPDDKLDHPVVLVTFADAQRYCKWLTELLEPEIARLPGSWRVSLPTEHQWIRAARGESTQPYPWSDVGGPTKDLCNFDGLYNGTTTADQTPHNVSPFGVLDMVGNVWEWTRSALQADESVLHGGCWVQGMHLDTLKIDYRLQEDPTEIQDCYGFRVVLVRTD